MKSARRLLFYLGLGLGWVIFGWQLYVAAKTLIRSEVVVRVPAALLCAGILMVLYFVIQVVNWYTILVGVGGKAAFVDIARGYFMSFVPRYIPGTVWGYISRSEWMLTRYQIAYRFSALASLIEVIISITSALTVVGLLGLLMPFEVSPLLLLSLLLPWLVWLVLVRLERLKPIVILKFRLVNPLQPITPTLWIKSHLIFFGQWLIFGLIYWLIIVSIAGHQVITVHPVNGIIYSIFAFTLSWTVGFMVPFIPGGIGIREFVLAGTTSNLLGLNLEMSSLVAVGLRILSSVIEILLILISSGKIRLPGFWNTTKR